MVAQKILETAQSLNSPIPFLFDFGLGHGTLDSGLSIKQYAKTKTPLASQLIFLKVHSHGKFLHRVSREGLGTSEL